MNFVLRISFKTHFPPPRAGTQATGLVELQRKVTRRRSALLVRRVACASMSILTRLMQLQSLFLSSDRARLKPIVNVIVGADCRRRAPSRRVCAQSDAMKTWQELHEVLPPPVMNTGA